jgi:transcriptional regulator with XRE-family HTH domain
MALKPFAVEVGRLREERGWSIERLVHEAWQPEIRGTSPAMIRKALKGERTLTIPLMTAVAEALDVDPGRFLEYRLALARRMLDEREVGLETAAENYETFAKVLPEQTPVSGE